MISYPLKEEVQISVDEITLTGDLFIPENPKGIVVFAHGSGSSRHSSRNKQVAQVLQQERFATLLFDLLTMQEDEDYNMRFDIDLLAGRLIKVSEWLKMEDKTRALNQGYFGASTGAAAALKAAAELKSLIKAVVSRGGRPDLAQPVLSLVTASTLLIVGSLDQEVIRLNEQAYAAIKAEKRIEIINGASHLFEEPGKLEIVAALAVEWFNREIFQ